MGGKLSEGWDGDTLPPDTAKPLVVMDTNVVLDLWLFRNPGLVWLASAVASGSLQWVATAAMLEELSHVRIRRFGAHHSAMSELFSPPAHRVPTPRPLDSLRCRDRSDQMFLDLAMAWGCPLLTRDRHLLCLQRKARNLGLLIAPPEQARHLSSVAEAGSPP